MNLIGSRTEVLKQPRPTKRPVVSKITYRVACNKIEAQAEEYKLTSSGRTTQEGNGRGSIPQAILDIGNPQGKRNKGDRGNQFRNSREDLGICVSKEGKCWAPGASEERRSSPGQEPTTKTCCRGRRDPLGAAGAFRYFRCTRNQILAAQWCRRRGRKKTVAASPPGEKLSPRERRRDPRTSNRQMFHPKRASRKR